MPQPRTLSSRPSPPLQSFRWDQETLSACPEWKRSVGWQKQVLGCTARTSMAPLLSTSTDTQSPLRWRVFNNFNLRRFVVVLLLRLLMLCNQLAGGVSVLLAHQDYHSTQSRERIL